MLMQHLINCLMNWPSSRMTVSLFNKTIWKEFLMAAHVISHCHKCHCGLLSMSVTFWVTWIRFSLFFVVTRPRSLKVHGRTLTLNKACGTIADCTFEELCDRVMIDHWFIIFLMAQVAFVIYLFKYEKTSISVMFWDSVVFFVSPREPVTTWRSPLCLTRCLFVTFLCSL